MARTAVSKVPKGDLGEARGDDVGERVQGNPLAGARLWISSPCHDNRVDTGFARALTQTTHVLKHFGVECGWGNLDNDSDIVRGRMGCNAQFMNSGYDKCLFIDSDIEWNAKDVLRLLLHDVDFICGVYRKHSDNPSYVVNFLDGEKVEMQEIGFPDLDVTLRRIKIREAGTGFMMYSRKVVETLMEAHPELHIQLTMFRGENLSPEREKLRDDLQRYYYNLFFPMMVMREDPLPHHLTEDYSFCQRWRDLGGDVWADPDIELTHVGQTRWKGKLAEYLKLETAKPLVIPSG